MIKRSWINYQPFETIYRSQGYLLIAGVDEVGRGAIAGPLVVAGLVLPVDFNHPWLRDSKELTSKQREKLAKVIRENALSLSLAWIEVDEIKKIGITRSFLLGVKKVIKELGRVDLLLIDGPQSLPDYRGKQKAIVKGDKLSLNIAGASIVAKVERDRYMEELDLKFPGYSFAKHKGYATAQHLKALQKLGPTPCHRTFYSCFARWLNPTKE